MFKFLVIAMHCFIFAGNEMEELFKRAKTEIQATIKETENYFLRPSIIYYDGSGKPYFKTITSYTRPFPTCLSNSDRLDKLDLEIKECLERTKTETAEYFAMREIEKHFEETMKILAQNELQSCENFARAKIFEQEQTEIQEILAKQAIEINMHKALDQTAI